MKPGCSRNIGFFLLVCLVGLIASAGVVIADSAADTDNTAANITLVETYGADPGQSVLSAVQNGGVIEKGALAGDSLVGYGGASSFGVFRPSTQQFIFNTAPISRVKFGVSTDKPVTGDWDNDGKTEIGVFRNGQFILDLNNDGVVDVRVNFGVATDTPITGDWDNDNFDEIGVWRRVGSAGQFILDNTNCNAPGTRSGVVSSRINFGLNTDKPVPIDYNEDGWTEVAVWRPSTREFIRRMESGGADHIGSYGISTDSPFNTWDSDGHTWYGVWRQVGSAGQFIYLIGTTYRTNFGTNTDKPITGKDWEVPPSSTPERQVETWIIYYSNLERANRGLTALAELSTLTTMARDHSTDMKNNNFFSHVSPTYGDMGPRFNSHGFTFSPPVVSARQENIYMTNEYSYSANPQTVAYAIVYDWVWDDAGSLWGHRHNILDGITSDPGYNNVPWDPLADPGTPASCGYHANGIDQIGVGVVYDSDPGRGWIVTQDFVNLV